MSLDEIGLYVREGDKHFNKLNFEQAKVCYNRSIDLYKFGQNRKSNPDLPLLVSIFRKLGTSSLYQEKWERESDSKLKEFQCSLAAFSRSLDLAQSDKVIHLENIQALTNIFFNEFPMKTDEHSMAKINLTESFLIFLTSHIDVAGASQVTSMKPIRQKVIEIWINLMQRSLEIASKILSDGNVSQALNVVDGSLKNREQVEKQMFMVDNNSENYASRISAIDVQAEGLKARSRGIRILYNAKKTTRTAREQSITTKQEDLLFLALDQLKEAEQMVLHYDDALTCWLQVEMGLVHLHLKNLTSAKSKFQQVLMKSSFLELSSYEWYAVAVCKLEEIAKVEAAERERIFRYEGAVHQIKMEFQFGSAHFVKFILNRFPPVHFAGFKPLEWQGPFITVSKKTLLKVIQVINAFASFS